MVNTPVSTWGIGETEFLAFYGALSVLVAGWLGWEWRKLVGSRERRHDPYPRLGAYKMAMLAGGPQLAITTAAAKLRKDGYLREGDTPRTLVAEGQLPAGSDPLEREVFGAVHLSPGLSVQALRGEVADSEPVKHLQDELTRAGLLIEEMPAKRLRRLWIAGALVAALGIARLLAVWSDGAKSSVLIVAVAVVIFATFRFALKRPFVSERGRSFLRSERQGGRQFTDFSSSSELAYAVALWGGAALWSADPTFASTLGVPREGDAGTKSGWNSGGGCGAGCSAGAGGCGSPSSYGGGGGCGGGGGGCGGGGG